MKSWLKLFVAALALLASPAYAVTVPATITSGTAISSPVNLAQYIHVGSPTSIAIIMPAAWTSANLTFLVSNDNGSTYTQLFDGNGNEYVVNADASRYILLDPAVFGYLNYFEIRSADDSVPPSTPVNQASTRTIQVVALPTN